MLQTDIFAPAFTTILLTLIVWVYRGKAQAKNTREICYGHL